MDDHGSRLFNKKDNFKISKDITSITIFEAKLKQAPLITIAIPTYKRVDILKQAIDSALNQKCNFIFDIIVVDNNPERNCSTEQLLKLYDSDIISYYKNSENLQMVGNWNRLFMLAKGEFVIMLHDDDLLYPDFLSKIHGVLINLNYDFDAVYTPWIIKDKNVVDHFPKRKNNNKFYIEKLKVKDFLWGNIVGPPVGMCLRKTSVIACGGFDMDFYPSLDYAFYVKFGKKFNCFKLTGLPLWIYRIGDNESLKTETLINFVKVDTIIKKQILIEINSKYNLFWHKYINVFVYRYLTIMTRLFKNDEINVNQNLTKLGYQYNFLDLLIYRIMNLIKFIQFKIKRKPLT